ncbi:MAG: UvrD-helicase domain-containing protein [Bacteroidales bacterium]|nr:UvrD-helicase domain-containing protein [Candidatus Cryptobacteroides caccocaballi]MCQ2161615.1 UvrD-helicase domain-containing protein [Bacteroidales bacterium]
MSFFSKLFSRPSKSQSSSETLRTTGAMTSEHKQLVEFYRELKELLNSDKYLAVSDYKEIVPKYADIYNFFLGQKRAKTLTFYCQQNDLQEKWVEKFLEYYVDIDDFKTIPASVEKHNKAYVANHLKSEKEYLDTILRKVDPAINLDDEQRQVVLSDEDYTLVIAGAGAGKTTTVAAKVRYLVEKKGIKPEQILVISFTNKAVGELRDKINKGLGIPCPVTTFHSTGYAILRKKEAAGKNIVDGGFMFNVINNYLKGNILEQPELVDKLILFFGSYFDAPYEGDDLNTFFNYISKADFSTLKGNMSEYTEEIINKRTGNKISIAHETLRSAQEVSIANFLYLNNIDYRYEKPYQFNIIRAHKPYTPDFTLKQGDKIAYLEHFGITEDGRNNRYTAEQLEKYKAAINDKVLLHRKHKTDLIYTFSSYNDGRPMLEHLKEQLIEHGFILNQRSSQEVFEKIVNTEENKYILKLVKLICTFIQNFKTNGYTVDKFYEWETQTTNERTRLFLDVCQQCYLEYAKRLKEKRAVDFEDMINESARILNQQLISGKTLDFKYIIVDEYQDISRQRFDLTKALSQICDAKIIAVGDDWQSIYAYAGSDITLFTKFQEAMGYGQELKITRTYRNAQEVIDIAGGFIQKNDSQLKKALVSPKHIQDPVVIESYTEEVDRKQTKGKGGKYYMIGKTVEGIVAKILEENPKSSILLLGRYGFDAYNLSRSADFIYDEKTGGVQSKKFPGVRLEFMTVHRAKGLGFDNVIIINARNELYGFPSQIQEDPVLKFVVKDDYSIEYAEERRLFYVALTRTKNRVYIVAPEQHPSKFVTELINDFKSVKVKGKINEDDDTNPADTKRCPICGYPLQLRYKPHYGLKLWLCSNEPEICDFMTNDLRGGELSIMKCDKCQDGYLIVKEGKVEPFLGCTNYKSDKTGCDGFMTKEYYLKHIHEK